MKWKKTTVAALRADDRYPGLPPGILKYAEDSAWARSETAPEALTSGRCLLIADGYEYVLLYLTNCMYYIYGPYDLAYAKRKAAVLSRLTGKRLFLMPRESGWGLTQEEARRVEEVWGTEPWICAKCM